MPDAALLTASAVTFLIAGVIKGVVGFGMPTVALASLAAGFGLKTAIALTIFPVLLTNIWQAVAGGHLVQLLRRLAPLLIMLLFGIAFGTWILSWASPQILTIILGGLICIYALTGLANWRLPQIGSNEIWASPLIGSVNGVITGVSGTFIMPGILYLQSLGLKRDELIQAMGIVFCLSTATLGIFLQRAALLPQDLATISALSVPFAFVGMWLGRRISQRLSDNAFDRAFFWGLLIVGAFLIVRNSGVL